MPTESLHITASDQNIKSKVESLSPTPGYCIFIDIVKSTEMKQKGLKYWLAMIHNCFVNCEQFLPPFSLIKSIGDELMYFIEESDLKTLKYTPLGIYNGLWEIATDETIDFPEVKIGAAYCRDVYPISFFRGIHDYYGIDIDLTARLKALAKSRQVIIDSRFYDKIMESYNAAGNKKQFVSVGKLIKHKKRKLKGISEKVGFYSASK